MSALTSGLQGGSAPRAAGQRPEWLKDPLLTALKCPAFLENWGKSFERRPPAPRDGGLWSENTVQIRKAGATIIMGSHDAGGQRVIGWGSHMEMEAFVNWVGMTPSEAIQSATSVSAKFIGVDDRLGTIAVGKGAISSSWTPTRSTTSATRDAFHRCIARQTSEPYRNERSLAGCMRRVGNR